MEKFIFFFIHWAIPILIVVGAGIGKSRSKIGLFSSFGLYFLLLFYLYSWGQWALVGSYYLRYFLLLFMLYILYVFVRKSRKSLPLWPKKKLAFLWIVPAALLTVFLLTKIPNLVIRNDYAKESVSINFPLRNGKFYIASGGSNKVMNNHFRDYPNSQQFALDINRLGNSGSALKNILSDANVDHHIFEDTVYCPCDGVVVQSKNSVDDNKASSMNVDPENGRGNFVSINCEEVLVQMYHLKKGTLMVSAGDTLKTGELVGLVGNSGFSQEPHLHIQASEYNEDSVLVGIPLEFIEKGFLSRNDIVNN